MLEYACDKCSNKWTSRNKLFKHIRDAHVDSVDPNFLPNAEIRDITFGNDGTCINKPLQLFNSLSPNAITQHGAICGQSAIEIAAEDEWYRVVIKPQMMPTMGLAGVETLLNSDAMLIENARSYKKAVPCHRLDRATGGLVVCSKNKTAESRIMRCFRDRLVHKRYRAIVSGRLEPMEGKIELQVGGQDAVTLYKVQHYTRSKKYDGITTVDLWPVTGRKHQLRKHLRAVGHAIIGDRRYESALRLPSPPFSDVLFLWALEVTLPHPMHVDFGDGSKNGENKCSTETIGDINDNISSNVGNVNSRDGSKDTSTDVIPVTNIHIHVVIDEPSYFEEFRQSQIAQAQVT